MKTGSRSAARGKEAEYAFAALVLQQGGHIAFPTEESLPIDALVDFGDGAWLKVQVKRAYRNKRGQMVVNVASRRSKRVVDSRHVDLLVVAAYDDLNCIFEFWFASYASIAGRGRASLLALWRNCISDPFKEARDGAANDGDV